MDTPDGRPSPPQPDPQVSEFDLAAQLKRHTGQMAAINQVVTAVSQSLDLHETLQMALRAVLSVVPVESSGISLVDDKAGELVMRAQHGLTYDFVSDPMRIKLGHGFSGRAATTGQAIVLRGDLSPDDPNLFVPAFAQEKTKAMVLAPMSVRGKVIGVLSVMSHDPYPFTEEEVNLLRLIADQIGIAIDNAQLFEAAKREQRRLEAVLYSTADAIIAVDMNGAITLLNSAAETLFGIEADKVQGQPITEIELLPLIIRDKARQTIMRGDLHESVRFDLALENERFLLMTMSPVYSQVPLAEEQSDGWVAVFQDITHIKDAERARLHFIQQAAHDLRNPLGVTLSALTMLNRNWKNPTVADQEVFNIALSGINRMQDLIDDLLNLQRIESGVDFKHDPLNLAELVERCVIDMGPVLSHKNQHLALVVEPTLPTFYGDERWLQRAVMNLISNAHKYTPDGSTVTLRVEAYNGHIVLAVEDNGPGIPLEFQSRLFERFYRVPSTERISGTGLGLAMVKSVAEKHGGRAYVSSEVGRGSTFRLIMPIVAPT